MSVFEEGDMIWDTRLGEAGVVIRSDGKRVLYSHEMEGDYECHTTTASSELVPIGCCKPTGEERL